MMDRSPTDGQAYVAQVCRQPLAADQAPWQVLVLPLHEDPDGRTTCLVSKAHRRLSNELHVLLGRWTASCRPVETPSAAKEFPLESWNLAPWNPAGVEPVPGSNSSSFIKIPQISKV